MDKTSYALGMNMAMSMAQAGIKNLDIKDFAAGFKAAFQGGDAALSEAEAGRILSDYFARLNAEKAAEAEEVGHAMRRDGAEFQAAYAQREGVRKLASGLMYRVLREGTGRRPGPRDQVRCHYEGTFTDGKVFDSSYQRGEPAVFGVNQVIAGWTEALQLMGEGSQWELCIPYDLAYGEAGAHGAIPPYATLVFKVELLEVL